MNFILLIQAVGILQGLILSLALIFLRNGNFKANKFLGVCLFFLSINMYLHAFSGYIYSFNFIKHELAVNLLSLLYGPLIYFYILALTFHNFKFEKKSILHFSPFFILSFFSYFLGAIFSNYYSSILYTIKIITFIQVFLYLVYMLFLLKRFSEKVKESFSTTVKINLNWLKYLIVIFLLIWITAIICEFFLIISWDYFWISVSILIYIIGYFALWQPEIFKLNIGNEYPINEKKYEKSSLNKELIEKYFNKLNELMKKEKPYIQPDITLPGLAKMMNLSTHHLSQLLNQKYKQNFFEFINQHRIEEAKLLIKDPHYKNIKIIEIGYEAGFNSISSFNSAFKKYTSLTPTEFKNKFYSNK